MHIKPTDSRTLPRRWTILITTVSVVGAMAATTAPSSAAPSAPAAPASPVKAWVKHVSYPAEYGIAHPTGLAYSQRDHALLVTAPRSGGGTALLATNTAGRHLASTSFPDTLASGAVTVDPATRRLVGLAGTSLVTLNAGQAVAGVAKVAHRPTGPAVPTGSAGLAFAPDGRMFALDPNARAIDVLRVPQAGQLRRIGRISLASLPGGALAGLAYNAADGLLYVDVPAAKRLYGIDQSGAITTTYDMSRVKVSKLASMAFAPSADPTDPAATTSLYLADAGSGSTSGAIAEVALVPQAVIDATATATLVNTTATSAYAPPSPDPAGITYLPSAGRLEMADSEVDEMTIFQDVNLWGLNTDGSQVANTTGSTLAFSHEPTGLAYDVNTGHMWVSDDDQQKIFDVAPGADGAFGTADDTWSSFSASKAGATDPEDVTVNTDNGDLYIIDGVGAEVYDISPGPNQRFDGVPPTGDDVVSHFDVATYGATDPEGIFYSAERDSLFVVDHNSHRVYELTTAGALLNSVDISAAGGTMEASLTLAPSSTGPGTSFYITDRRIDNDLHPDENDGALYELQPNLPNSGNAAPRVNAGPDESLALGQAAPLSGTVTDDNLPTGSTVTTAWSQVGGTPGQVTIADPKALQTTATFPVPGLYTLRLTATDGELSSIDDMAVQVIGPEQNLVTNPDFETNTTGWSTGTATTGVTLTQVSPGHTGTYAAQVSNPALTAAKQCYLTDSPNSVATTTTVPASYTGSLWVRGDTAGAQLELALREYSGSTLVGSGRALVTLGTTWQQVSATYAPADPGVSSLDMTATLYGAPTGTCFAADDASITVSATPPTTTTATPAPASLTFADQAVGTTSAPQTVTVTNSGSNPLTVSSITLSGTGATQFAVDQGNCTTVPVGQNCSFGVTFTPTAAAAVTAIATVNANVTNGPLTVSLTGSGPVADLTLASIQGPSKPVSGQSATYRVTASNKGPAAASATITTTLPTGMTFLSAGGATCTASGSDGATVTCPGIPLAKDASSTVSIDVRVTAKSGSKLTISAAVSDSTTYDPTPADATRTLKITVAKPRLVPKSPAALSGQVAVEHTVYAKVGTVPSGSSYAYQWRLDGKALAGATRRSYRPTAAQVGHRLAVAITVTNPDYQPWTGTSPATAVAKARLGATRGAYIANKAGRALTVLRTGYRGYARHGAFVQYRTSTRVAGVKVRFQWLLDGKVIRGATYASYVPRRWMHGHWLRVRIVGTKAGYVGWTSVSARVRIR